MQPFNLRPLAAVSLTLAAATLLASCGQLPQRAEMQGVAGWSAVTFGNSAEQKPVTLAYGDRDRLTQLVSAGMDVWSVDVKRRLVQGTLTAEQAKLAESLGMKVEWRNKQAIRTRVDKEYRSYEQIAARLQELAAQKPEIAQLVDIGDSWEKTQGRADRDILALKLGRGTGKPVVTFVGCHHAREIVTPEMVLKAAEHLVEGYGQDAEVTAAIDNREIWIVPMVNPDGHKHALEGHSWRKNTNNVTGGKRKPGVDLNRNYDIAWGTVGDSGNPDSDTFRGKAPFSEPETQAVRDMLTKKPPVVYLTFHSYANTVMWPWDHKKEAPEDKRLMAVGQALGKLSGYDAFQGAKMYLNSGDDVDWAHAKLGSLTYTVEVGSWNDGFMPSASKLPKFWDENRPMMMYALKIAENPDAVFGPEIKVERAAGGVKVNAPASAAAVEVFRGRPGRPGTGEPLAVRGPQTFVPAGAGPRELLYVRAQGKNGQWGPT
ncbi:MAG: M14 family metallopeptidase, partial [Candidatus Sericytochromatia bacterium]